MALRLIYVAGPYRAKTVWGVEQNIHRARAIGAQLCSLGAYAVIPHSNTAHFDGLAPDEFWLEATLELMRRCDAVMMVPGWGDSSGARAEREEALRLLLPVFYTFDDVGAWLQGKR